MPTSLTPEHLDALLANLDPDGERAGERYEEIRRRLVRLFEWRGCGSAEDLADVTMNRVARKAANGLALPPEQYAYFCGVAYYVWKDWIRLSRRHNALAAQERWLITPPAEESNPVSPAPVSMQTTEIPTPPLERLRCHLQTHVPVLYLEVLEPTLADLREEYSTALAEGHPWKARRILLQGCGALAAAAASQFGVSLLGRIAALWKARSPK